VYFVQEGVLTSSTVTRGYVGVFVAEWQYTAKNIKQVWLAAGLQKKVRYAASTSLLHVLLSAPDV
jgi:hypothetical protein